MNIIELIISGALSIIGVVVGVFLNNRIHVKDFEKKVHGAEFLIKSELKTNVKYLSEYYNKFLNTNFKTLKESGSLQNLDDFYYNLKFFPIISHKYLDKLIDYAPEIFNPNEIEMIIQFCIELDKLNQQVEIVYSKEYDKFKKNVDKSYEESSHPYCLEDFLFMELDIEGYDEIISVWRGFELKFKDVLDNGEEVLEFIK